MQWSTSSNNIVIEKDWSHAAVLVSLLPTAVYSAMDVAWITPHSVKSGEWMRFNQHMPSSRHILKSFEPTHRLSLSSSHFFRCLIFQLLQPFGAFKAWPTDREFGPIRQSKADRLLLSVKGDSLCDNFSYVNDVRLADLRLAFINPV